MTRPGEVRDGPAQAGRERLRLEFRPAADGGARWRSGSASWPPPTRTTCSPRRSGGPRADAAVVVVGSAEMTESEGFDRETLALPGRQDELVRRVAAVNARTVVVVNAGMPVLMPWAEQVAAVIYAWLPGQAMGEALADVLLGRAEPGGRLPVTLPAARPTARSCTPCRGRAIDYAEGLLIGYRGYDAGGSPAFRSATASATPAGRTSRCARTGRPGGRRGPPADRRGPQYRVTARPEVVQVYLADPPADGRRSGCSGPSPVTAAPGERAEVSARGACPGLRPGWSPAGPGRRALHGRGGQVLAGPAAGVAVPPAPAG